MRRTAIALATAALSCCLLAANAQATTMVPTRSLWQTVLTQRGPGVQSDYLQVHAGHTRYQLVVHSDRRVCVRISGKDGTVPCYFKAGTHKLVVYLPAWRFRVHTASSGSYAMRMQVWTSTDW